MNEFKNFITCVIMAVTLMLTIVASVGAINYGMKDGSFYIVAGVLNLLGWGGAVCYAFYKKFIKKD